MAKKKPQAGGRGAQMDVGATDMDNRNTDSSTASSMNDEASDSVLVFDDEDVPVPDDDAAETTAGWSHDSQKGMSQTMVSAMNAATPRRESANEVIIKATKDFLATLDPDNPPPDDEIESRLCDATFRTINLRNTQALKEDRWPVPRHLTNLQVALVVIWKRRMSIIELAWEGCTDEERMESRRVGMYVPETGRYTTDLTTIGIIAHAFNRSMRDRDVEEVIGIIGRELALAGEVRRPNRDPNLVNLKNTNYNIGKKAPFPHTPDIVFLTGIDVNYNPNAKLVKIEMPDGKFWDIESAILEWAGNDPEVQELIWRVLASAGRPYVRTNKMVWFYGKTGNNGKGTICQLIRNMVGASCGSYAMADYGLDAEHRFNLAGIERIQANVVDENDDVYLPSLARLRAAITNDVFKVHVKHEKDYYARECGLNLQCINDLPTMKSKGGNMLRRILVVPFVQCYTGIERPYIKQDYIARPEVLEYVVLKILTMDFDGFNEPAVCKQMLDVFEENNNPVLEFLYRFAQRLSWDLAPKTFLYALFRGWYASVNPTGKPKSLKEFWPLVEMACTQHGDELGWRVLDNPKRPGHMMDIPEPLIVEYVRDEKDLKKWTSPKYADGGRYEVVGLPAKPSGSYDGLIRVVPRPTEPDPPDVADLPVDQDGRAYTMDDPDADGELLRDEYCAYLAEHARIESEVAAGKAEHDYRQGRSMSRGWFDGDCWCVNRFHPQQGDWLRVEYDGKPDDADEALQYGSWLSLRTDLRYADDPEYVGHAVLELALNKQTDDQE